MRSSNPVLRERVFSRQTHAAVGAPTMTVDGTMGKTAILLMLVLGGAVFTWNRTGAMVQGGGSVAPWMWGGMIVGFVLALVISFKPGLAPMLAPAYALCEGLFLGAISAMYNALSQGIALQAVLLTVTIALSMLALYRFRIIRVTQRLRTIVMAAMGAVFLVYMLSFVLRMFGGGVPFLHSTGPLGIGISVVFIGVASFMLLLDFDLIERGARQGAPKAMEWYGAFALLVTLVWLYIEVLRLLAKLQSRR